MMKFLICKNGWQKCVHLEFKHKKIKIKLCERNHISFGWKKIIMEMCHLYGKWSQNGYWMNGLTKWTPRKSRKTNTISIVGLWFCWKCALPWIWFFLNIHWSHLDSTNKRIFFGSIQRSQLSFFFNNFFPLKYFVVFVILLVHFCVSMSMDLVLYCANVVVSMRLLHLL